MSDQSRPVYKYATSHIVSVKATETVAESYTKMKKFKIHHLPVINEFHQIVGLLSEINFQRAMITAPSKDVVFMLHEKVADIMSTDIDFVDVSSDLAEVVELMMNKGVSSVLIADGQKLFGIITTNDILRLFLEITKSTKPSQTETGMIFSYLKPLNEIALRLAEIGI